ncbi:beta-ketoacyl synthase N-terminal-like domain-containing protein [Streptomyces sp. NPDC058045]|uniref:beta-ketoacyl synthase N-terminal-like domain-containing protein n=1 Tax=Streptomyces sp. NPDC058045 TaxID=3346311 RepID=UPI0036E08F8C
MRAEGCVVRSVFHTAGVPGRFVPVAETTVEDMEEVFAGKVRAAVALDELFAGQDLDAFVLYSSIAGVSGGHIQGPYAAANAFLDALAERRRARGDKATSIAWGLWAGDGFGSRPHVDDALRLMGARAMEPEQALTSLGQILDRDETTMSIVSMDWERWISMMTANRASHFYDEILDKSGLRERKERSEEAAVTKSEFAGRLSGLAPADQQRLVLDLVRAEAAGVVGYASGDAVDRDLQFQELGFNSISAVEFRNKLAEATGLKLPISLVYDYPSPAAVARYLRTELIGDDTETAVSAAIAAAPGIGDDQIAIVGMSCRLPGGVQSPEDLWRLVVEGRDVISGLPDDRGWEAVAKLREMGINMPGGSWVNEGGFIDDVADFDPEFFGISDKEALAMDPQHRVLLEMTWEAVERAGIDPHTLRGSNTGVFVGTFFQPYWTGPNRVSSDVEAYISTGVMPAFASARVGFQFGFEGPSITSDSGCSSSGVALHLACQALSRGECSAAVVGGVTVMSTPMGGVDFGGMAADGRCKSFSQDADGTGWGEGAAVLMLEPLSEARRQGHRVLATIRGTAMNHNGRESNGPYAPSGPSQQKVIRRALASAGLTPDQVDFVEAHGTGTPIGDSIEAQALLATYGQGRPEGQPLWLGTVKSNIGHPQAASGVVGVVKTVMSLQHGVLPKSLHGDVPSTQVDWASGAVSLVPENMRWPETGRPRRAGVTSLGASGTKMHVILEHYEPEAEPVEEEGPGDDEALPVLVSSRTEEGLRDQARRLREFLTADSEARARDVAWSLATTRSTFRHRAAVLATGRDELVSALAALERGEAPAGTLRGEAVGETRTALVLSGEPLAGPAHQGAGAARELYDRFPAFADALDEACSYLDAHLDAPAQVSALAPVLPEAAVDRAAAVFAVEVGFAQLLRSLGLRPDMVVGHGLGEISAACLTGALTMDEAAGLLVAAVRLREPDQNAYATEGLFLRAAKRCAPAVPSTPLVSASTGDPLPVDDLLTSEHWSRPGDEHPTASPVLGERTQVLSPAGLDAEGAGVVADLLAVLTRAHVNGARVPWGEVFRAMGVQGRTLDLPTYGFQRKSFWLKANPVATVGEALEGKNVHTWRALEGQTLLDEKARREVVEEYFRRLNAGDLEATVEMFAPDIRMEDPVGQTPYVGIEEVRKYVDSMIKSNVEVTAGRLVASQDGVHVSGPLVAQLNVPGADGKSRMKIDAVDVLRVNGEGKIEEIRVFWGMTDVNQ